MRVLMGVLIMLTMNAAGVEAKGLKVSSMRGWTVVVAEDAIPSERYAAEEFQSLFKQAAGIDLPIASKAAKRAKNVFIGLGAAVALGINVDDLGQEGLRIRIKGDNIAIAGGRPRGTLYGVYEFFERYLGVRFLTCDHTYIPEDAKKVKLPSEDYSYLPPFSFRWTYYKENMDNPVFAAKLRVNTVQQDEKLGGSTGQKLINHSLLYLLPVGEYGKDHPEYFALVDGVRKLDVGGGPQICPTNPEVLDIVTEAVMRQIEANPKQENFSVSQNDHTKYCRCPNCEAINEREGTPMGAHLAFVNAVAERVEKKHPNVKIGTLAYSYTRKAPKTIVPRHNVQIQLCSYECCTLHPINDPKCEKNRGFSNDLAAWKKICNDIWVWNYNTNFHRYDLPFPNLQSIGPNVRYFGENNVKGVFMQANGNGNSGEMCDLRNYVISRCLWRPGEDSWKLTEEFCQLHYGKAAGPILEHLMMLHDSAEAAGVHPGCTARPPDVGVTPEIAAKSYNLFQQALALADDDAVRARVEKASICAYRALLEGGAPAGDTNVPGREELIDRYISLCKRHNMSMASEGRTASAYFEKLKKK